MSEQEYERQLAKLQSKVAALVAERDRYRDERDEYRARATVFSAGFDVSGIVAKVKELQQENEELRARLARESLIEQITVGKFFPLLEGKAREKDMPPEINVTLAVATRQDDTVRANGYMMKWNGDPEEAFQAVDNMLYATLWHILPTDIPISKKLEYYGITDQKFIIALEPLLPPYHAWKSGGKEYAYKNARTETRDRFWQEYLEWYKLKAGGKNEKDNYNRNFEQNCDRTLENVYKRIGKVIKPMNENIRQKFVGLSDSAV